MKRTIWTLTGLTVVAWLLGSGLLAGSSTATEQVSARPRIKVAVLEKVAKGQSARRFGTFYPELARAAREAFSRDGRFEVISPAVIDQALADLGTAPGKIDPDDIAQLREIGGRAGADLVLAGSYYEMSCHGGPMRSNSGLSLVRVDLGQTETVHCTSTQELSSRELASGDASALEELLRRAESLLADR